MQTKSLTGALALLLLVVVYSCKPESPNPPSGNPNLVIDSIEYKTSGSHELTLDFDATAKVFLVGGGGGGGGGVRHSGNNGSLTTGGGGGGGAGEVKEFNSIELKANITYVIFVGKAGLGGTLGNNGQKGGNTSITDNDGMFKMANAGGQGRSGVEDQYVGGVGGTGYPGGAAGETGLSTGAGPNEDFAKGGSGGINNSGFGSATKFGTGGGGGQGSSTSNGNIVQGGEGQHGLSGYVKIVYEQKE